jgi:hypothetical protein
VELVSAFKQPAPAVAAALALVLAYRDRGHPARIADKYADQVAAAVHKEGASSKGKLAVVFDIDDTLIRDRSPRFVLNPTVVQLHERLVELGAHVHLVTARANDAETLAWTRDQLKEMGIRGYTGLHLAPESRRGSMTDVSHWKMETRRSIARKVGAPIVLTVGDQWGDMVTLSDDADIDALDATFAPDKPWKVVRPNDGVSLWGLKLRAYN